MSSAASSTSGPVVGPSTQNLSSEITDEKNRYVMTGDKVLSVGINAAL